LSEIVSETDRKVSIWQSSLTVSQRVQIDSIFNGKSATQLPNYLKMADTTVVLIVFIGVICYVSAYTVTVSFRRST
jgi:hypothetical protein